MRKPKKIGSSGVGKVLARRRLAGLTGARKKKYYQISEAVTLFTKGMRELTRYYPIPKRAIKEFEEAVKQKDVLIEVLPGEYLAKNGRAITAGEMVYSPGKRAWVIKLPASAFDEFGNLKPDSVLTLWHELTHVVRSFIPQLERLPTAYDEATTNFIADRLAMLFSSGNVRTRYLKLDPTDLENARIRWRQSLVYRPELVEGIFSKVNLDKLAEEHRKKLLTEFARGIMLKKKIRGLVSNELDYLKLLRDVNPKLYRIHLVNESRKKLLKNRKSLEKWARGLSKSALLDALAKVKREEPEMVGYFADMKKGDDRLVKVIQQSGLSGKTRAMLTKLRFRLPP